MEDKRTPVIAGLSGAALIAAVLSVGGSSSAPEAGPAPPKATLAATTETRSEMTSNQDGPWYAFCQEYATDEFDRGTDPSLEKGIQGHRVPEEADEGTVEITRPTRDKKTHTKEWEKFNVRKHMIGDLASCVNDGTKLRVAIAFVPDPDETEMRLDFDRDIDALQSAAAAEHYNYTRFWFPWRSTNWVPDKAADPEPEMRRREEPGILCFRKSGDAGDRERLFVLLVGETPTSGVNRIQFAHALYYRQQLRGDNENPLSNLGTPNAVFNRNKIVDSDADQISIVGPHFSSSFTGIEDVLNQTAETSREGPKPAVHLPIASFISPDASGQKYLGNFRDYCSDWKSNCRLRTLSLSSTEAESAAACYLKELGYPGERIAALTEDESAFGASTFNAPTVEPDHKDPDQPCQDHQAEIELRLHFPRDLSSVRSLSDQASAKLAESGSKYFSLPGGSMPIQLTAREPVDRDSPPAFGTEQVAAQVARSLADAVEQMRARRIRAVVIVATNPLDQIYLLEYLRNQLPDMRTVVVDVDELELDKPHFTDLTGTIAITALPTLPGMVNAIQTKQLETKSPPMSFKSSRQLGEFLALEMALEPNFEPGLLADADRCCLVSVVGSTGFRSMPYPAVDTSNPTFPRLRSGKNPQAASASMKVPEHFKAPTSLLSLLVALITFNLVHFWCVYASRKSISGLLSYPCQLQPSREPDRAYLLFALNNQVLLLNLLVYGLSIATLHAIHRVSSPTYDPWLAALTVYGMLPCTIVSLILATRFFRFFKGSVQQLRDKGAKQMSWVLMTTALLYLTVSLWMIASLPAFHSVDSIFLERTTRVGEWLSPVFPIASIILGYFLWCWVQLKRLGWAASRETDLNLPAGIDDSFCDLVTKLKANVGLLLPESLIAMGVGFVLAIAVGCRLNHSLNGFDGGVFHGWFLFFGVGMLLHTVIITCFHAWSIWDQLKGLLDRLETTPMRDAFERLGKDGRLHIKVWDLATPQRSFIVWNQTVESLERLFGQNSQQAEAARVALDSVVQADAETRQLNALEICKLNSRLNAAISKGFQSMATKSPLAVPTELQTYFALRLIALIRYALLQIVTLIRFVAYGYVLAIGSIVFYPFEGRKLIGDLLTITFIGLLIWIAMMMAQFQQNGMLSRLEDTTPGKVSYGEVALHLLTVAGLPLVAIVTSQFPSAASFVFSLFRPVLGAIH